MTVQEKADMVYEALMDGDVREAVWELYVDEKLAEVPEYDENSPYWHTWEEWLEWKEKCREQ